MSYGLRVWDGSNKPILDISDRFFRIIQAGAVYLNNGQSTNVYINGISDNGNWLAHINYADWEDPSSIQINSGYITITNGWDPRTINYTVYAL